jgi:hypothetical protein
MQTRRKPFDTRSRSSYDFSNLGVRKEVSFWNEIGVRSRGVRQVFRGRTTAFEKSVSCEQKTTSQFVIAGRSRARNPLRGQHVMSTDAAKQKTLTPLHQPASCFDRPSCLAAKSVNPSDRKRNDGWSNSKGPPGQPTKHAAIDRQRADLKRSGECLTRRRVGYFRPRVISRIATARCSLADR